MKKVERQFPSSDRQTMIHVIRWEPEGTVKGVLQICHGMAEYIDRYDEFAGYLADRGFCVVGNDHLGHGLSVQSEEHFGFFHEDHGNTYVIKDIHKLRKQITGRYPGVPFFMLGHSMGSFLLRQYLIQYAEGLSGAIIMGTGYQSECNLRSGQLLCSLIAARKGWYHRSPLVHRLGMGGFNKSYEPSETGKDWITSDPEKLAAYVKDPLCSFTFTVNGYFHMFAGMRKIIKKKELRKMPEHLPVFFVSGADDPVGRQGKGVERVYRDFKQAGLSDLCIKLYGGGRHEILNETNRQEVYRDLYRWLARKCDDVLEVQGTDSNFATEFVSDKETEQT